MPSLPARAPSAHRPVTVRCSHSTLSPSASAIRRTIRCRPSAQRQLQLDAAPAATAAGRTRALRTTTRRPSIAMGRPVPSGSRRRAGRAPAAGRSAPPQARMHQPVGGTAVGREQQQPLGGHDVEPSTATRARGTRPGGGEYARGPARSALVRRSRAACARRPRSPRHRQRPAPSTVTRSAAGSTGSPRTGASAPLTAHPARRHQVSAAPRRDARPRQEAREADGGHGSAVCAGRKRHGQLLGPRQVLRALQAQELEEQRRRGVENRPPQSLAAAGDVDQPALLQHAAARARTTRRGSPRSPPGPPAGGTRRSRASRGRRRAWRAAPRTPPARWPRRTWGGSMICQPPAISTSSTP